MGGGANQGAGQGLALGRDLHQARRIPSGAGGVGNPGEFRGIQGGKGSESGSRSRGGVGPITEIF